MANNLEMLLKIVAYVDLAFSLTCTVGAIFWVVALASILARLAKLDPKPLSEYSGMIAIRLAHLVILFFLVEASLTLYLLHAVKLKNLARLKRWLVFGGIYTVLYITDFISTLHAMSWFENCPVTLGIFLKVPLVFLVWKYTDQLEKNHGDNLINEV